MNTEISIRNFINGERDKYNNFYDWFCTDSSLQRRANSFVAKLKFLVKEGILNQDTCYAMLKNNCPVNGKLYDDMRIITRDENNDFLGGFCPKTGHSHIEDNKKCSVWLLGKEFKDEIKTFYFSNWNEFIKEVKDDDSFKQILVKHFNI